ncbi:hypothetical protein HDV00_010532, partial [Rhizophlyctis rosea]
MPGGVLGANLGIGLMRSPAGITLDLDGGHGILVAANEVSALTDMSSITFNPEGALQVNADDITIRIIPGVDVPGRGLVKTGSVLSLAQAELDKLDNIPEDFSAKLSNMDNMQSELQSLTTAMEAMQATMLAETVSLQAQVAAALGAVIAEKLVMTATGALVASKVAEGQAALTSTAAAAIGAILAAAATGATVGSLLALIGQKKYTTNIYNTTVVGNDGLSSGGIEEGTTNYLYGFSILPGNLYDSTKYPYLNAAPCTVTPIVGGNLQPADSVDPYSGQLTILGGLGVSADVYVGGGMFMNTNQRVATESFVLNKNYLVASALTPYLLSSTAVSTYLTIANAGSTYLTSANAASTYLTIANANDTYQPIITAGTGLSKSNSTLSVNNTLPNVTSVGTLSTLT